MNVEKMYKISVMITTEMAETKILFDKFYTSLSQLGNGNLALQTAFLKSKDDFYYSLENSFVNTLSYRQIIFEIFDENDLGDNLKYSINDILTENTLTPASAIQLIKPIYENFTQKYNNLVSLVKIFSELGIELEKTDDDFPYEIILTFPKKNISGNLRTFEDDITLFRIFLDSVVEISGENNSYRIDKISSSDFNIDISATLAVGSTILLFIHSCLDAIKKVLEIKKLAKEAKEKNASEKSIKSLEADGENLIEEEIEKIVNTVLDKSDAVDKHRKNELKTSLKLHLKKIIKKFDLGYQLNIIYNIEQKKDDEQDENEENSNKKNEIIGLHDQINKLNFTAKYVLDYLVENDGKLSLPNLKIEEENSEGKK